MPEPKDKQEAYDKVREFFTRPGAVLAWDPEGDSGHGGCVYRGDEDPTSPLRCAIGCLIDDADYNPDFEGTSLTGSMALDLGWDNVDLEFRTFLNRIQTKHDEAAEKGLGVEAFLETLDDLAREYDLRVSE